MNTAPEGGLPLLDNLSHESMLTYAVLLGQQNRKHDPYAVGAQIMGLAVRGDCTIQETVYNDPNVALYMAPRDDMLEEEVEFVRLVQHRCLPHDNDLVSLDGLLANKPLANDMGILWKRVVMMHHSKYNPDRPLYSADPTRLAKWQRFRRALGWGLAAISVYAEPGFQGRVAGLAEVQKGYEEPDFIGNTAAGNALCHQVLALRRQMQQLAQAEEPHRDHLSAYEQALPYAFLFDDDLKDTWPTFLSRHYTRYPSWLKPAKAVEDLPGRQKHIAALLGIMSTLYFPAHRRRAHRE